MSELSKPRQHAWIFMSIGDECSISDISSVADGIMHAVPTQKELQESLRWLQQYALVEKKGKKYKLAEAGIVLRQTQAKTIFESLAAITQAFENIK